MGCGVRPDGGTHGCRPTGWFVGQGPCALPGGCGADPAARQTQRLPVSIGQHKCGARRGVRRRDDAKARHEICVIRFVGQEGTDTISTSAAERISKPWFWRRSLGTFCRCWQKVPRRRRLQVQEARRRGTDCHSRCAHRLRNDRIFYKGCGGYQWRGEGTPPYGWQGNLCKPNRAVGDAGPYGGTCERGGKKRAEGAAGWPRPGPEMRRIILRLGSGHGDGRDTTGGRSPRAWR